MSYQGRWEHWSEGKGWSLRIGPLFKGEISYTYRRDRYGYACRRRLRGTRAGRIILVGRNSRCRQRDGESISMQHLQ
jgi:hypothetical protein